ncbi:MAG: hypothetical protein AAF916_11765 [Planctomycetota bacterium]
MITVIHQPGSSFRGLVQQYLLHDKGADTTERVEWTHCHNLATQDVQTGWRIMAATSYMQHELKAQAAANGVEGVTTAGRKSSGKHVFHYTLSWAEEEAGEITREEMLSAALGSLSYIGTTKGEKIGKNRVAQRTQYGNEHQAIIVAHNDGKPHVHVCVQLVHPEHGVQLPDTKSKLKLSAWALDYRRAMGKEHYCPQRAINDAKRAAGLLTSHPRKPRNVYENEREQRAADPASRKRALLDEQQKRGRQLKRKTEQMKRQRVAEVRQMEDQFKQQRTRLRDASAERIRKTRSRVVAGFEERIQTLGRRQQDERERFEEASHHLAGRARNAWNAIKTKAWLTELRTSPLNATTEAFKLAFDAGMQKAQLDRHHASENRKLLTTMRQEVREATKIERVELQKNLSDQRQQYVLDRSDLLLRHAMDQAKLNAQWRQLDRDRRAARDEDGRAPEAERAMGEGSDRSGKGSAMHVPSSPRADAERVTPKIDDAPPPSKDKTKTNKQQDDKQSFRERRRASRRPPGRRDDTGPAGGRGRE